MKQIYTTQDVARICEVQTGTVRKWIDRGMLLGQRLPGSPYRRVRREHLIEFMQKSNMPLHLLDAERSCKILLVHCERIVLDRVRKRFPDDEDYQIRVESTAFAAGLCVEAFRPDVVVVDFAIGRTDAISIATEIEDATHLANTMLIALVGEDWSEGDTVLKHEGFAVVVRKPDINGLLEPIRERAKKKRGSL